MKTKFDLLLVFNFVAMLLFLLDTLFDGLSFNFLVSLVTFGFCIYYRGREEGELVNSKLKFFILALANLCCVKVFSAIILFVICWKLENYKVGNKENLKLEKKKPTIDPQIRKIDILLKLGVVMVFIAGFVFATTGWHSLDPIVKVFIMLLVSAAFIKLSSFCEKNIKIKSTIYLYWILGMTFIIFAFFTIGYGEIFGNYFSLLGEGASLYSCFISAIIGVLGLISYLKFKESFFLNFVYSGILFIIIFLDTFFNLSFENTLLTIVPILTIINLFKCKDDFKTLNIFANLVLGIIDMIFIVFTILCIFVDTNLIATIFLSVLLMFNIYNNILDGKDGYINNFMPFVAYLLLLSSFITLISKAEFDWVIVFIIMSLSFVIFNYVLALIINNKTAKDYIYETSDLILLLNFLIAFGSYTWLPLLIAISMGILYLVCNFIDGRQSYSTQVMYPINISMILLGCLNLVNDSFIGDDMFIYWVAASLLIFVLIYCLTKKDYLTKIYRLFAMIAAVIATVIVIDSSTLAPPITIFIAISLFYAEINWNREDKESFKRWLLLLLLINFFLGIRSMERILMNSLCPSYIFSNIVSIALYILVALFHQKDNFKFNICLLVVTLPMFSLIDNMEIGWISDILISILFYYSTFVLSTMLKNNSSLVKVIQYIGYTITYALVLFYDNNNYVLLYAFALIILSLLFGYYDKNYNALFKVSVVALIVGIIYQFGSFFTMIPLWLYLLLGGLILIGFATYKQMNIINKKDDENKDK